MSKFILGLDGGATKSHMVLFDSDGNCAGKAAYGCLNHDLMKGSYTELEECLNDFIPHTLKDMGIPIDSIAYAVFGLAGVDTAEQQVLISDMMRRIGFKEFFVCNDAFLGVAAGCPECIGICAINGTGFKVAAIDGSANDIHICGFGDFTSDHGGGPWYGARAIGVVYNELFRFGKSTLMRDMLFKLLNVDNREDYHEVVINSHQAGGLLVQETVNSVIFDAAALGDTSALDVLKESSISYADAIARLALDLDFQPDKTLHVTLVGSVFVKQKVRILHELIEERVKEKLPGWNVSYICLDFPPVVGAMMLAAQRAGIELEMSTVEEAIVGL